MTDRLEIRRFAQIAEADLTFGDLTVLVGAQGTGKSLALQWLKIALDGRQIVSALRDAGHATDKPEVLIDLFFGAGMVAAWQWETAIKFRNESLERRTLGRLGNGREKVFFIPAHRSMLISDGWAAPFQKLTTDVPVVARIFSQNLFDRLSARGEGRLFPLERVLKEEYREQIDDAVFHSGQVGIEEDSQHARRLRLIHGAAQLPFMTWTAGQREFTPLLLGLYHLLPSRNRLKQPDIDWVVIEEPEMGLHPRAICVVMLLVLDLLWRGYRVAISTHSPDVLTAIWMLRRLKEHRARWQLVCQGFNVGTSQQMQRVAQSALKKDYRVHSLAFGADGKVRSNDISRLDPDSEDEQVAGWGGLTEFSSRFGDAVRAAVNENI
ncbi:MAG: AAA family ATPase [Deltaproteobacteria bacterium]|nr:AAA family ATPase [Deltaproteobacteria bacterium]